MRLSGRFDVHCVCNAFPVTQVIDTYVYRALMVTGRVDMSSAAGLLQNVLGFVCILTANNIVKKIDADSSMF